MNELIEIIPNEIDIDTGVVTETIAVLNQDTSRALANFERQIKELKDKEDTLKQAILEEMEKANILKLDTPDLTITYVAPTTREALDSKSLRADMPEIYDEYVKISPVKSSIRIKVKEGKNE